MALSTALLLAALLSCSNPTQPGKGQGIHTFDYSSLPLLVAELELNLNGWNENGADLSGDNLVIAESNELTVVDVSNPTKPQITSQVKLHDRILSVAALPNDVLVLDQYGLKTLDLETLSTPTKPTFTFDEGETPTMMRVADHCFVATSAGALHYLYILDVEDPSKPLVKSKVTLGAEVSDLAQEQNLVMLGTKHGAVLLDISNTDQVKILSTIGKGQYVALANGFAYVNGTERGSSGVTALDIHDPTHPVEIGSSLAGGRGRMQLVGNRLYADMNQQIEVIDVVDRRHLQPEGSIHVEVRNGSFIREGYLWSVGKKLTVHRLGDYMVVPLVGESGVLVWSRLQLHNRQLYGRGAKGFFALSVYDATLSSPLNYLPGSYQGTKLVQGDRVFVYDNELAVRIYHLSTGALLRSFDLTPYTVRADDRVVGVKAQENHLYVVVADRISTRYQIVVIEVGSGRDPRVAGSLMRDGEPRLYVRGLELVEDQRLVVIADGFRADLGGVVDVIDVSKPHQPSLLSHTAIDDPSGSVAVEGDFMYLNTYRGLAVLDARNPNQPRQVALFEIESRYYDDLVVKHNVLYAMSRWSMDVIDVRYPPKPRLIATRGHLSTNAGDQLIAGDDVLYALMSYGIQVLPLHAH